MNYYLNSTFNTLRSNDSLHINIKSEAKYILHTAPILLLSTYSTK
jgi:hypothetical protein